MPKFANYQNLVNDFNFKYGVAFSYQEFEAEVNALKNSRASSAPGECENEVYVSTYKKILEKAIDNVIHAKLDRYHLDHKEMMKDYGNLMNGYLDAQSAAGNNIPMEWKRRSELLKSVTPMLEKHTGTNGDYIAQKYLNGEFRIRDMRARTNYLKEHKETNPQVLVGICAYAEALEKVNSQRSRLWRWLHPFRNRAEKRQAKEMRQYITDVENRYKWDSDKERFRNDIQEILDAKPHVSLKENINRAIYEIELEEIEAQTAESLKDNPNFVFENKKISANPVNVSDNAKEPAKENNLNLGNESKRENIGEQIKEDVKEEVNKKQPKNEKPTAMQKFNEVTEQDGFMNEFTKELAAIISRYSPSPNTHTIKEYLCDYLFNWTKDLCEYHDDAVSKQTRESEIGREMGNTVNSLYSGVLTGMDMYGVSLDNRPIVAQLVVDHALKKLSPAGFFPEKYGKYANRYSIETNSNDVIQTVQGCSYSLTHQDCVRICDNAKEQLREIDRISKATNENVDKNEEIQNERIEDRELDKSMVK